MRVAFCLLRLEFWQKYRTDWTPARVCLNDDDDEEEEEEEENRDTRAELENDTDARLIFLSSETLLWDGCRPFEEALLFKLCGCYPLKIKEDFLCKRKGIASPPPTTTRTMTNKARFPSKGWTRGGCAVFVRV